MKRKSRQPTDERRRPLAEINLADEERRLQMARKGCLGLWGSLLVFVLAAVALTLAAAVGAVR